jgi:hypothetical protein
MLCCGIAVLSGDVGKKREERTRAILSSVRKENLRWWLGWKVPLTLSTIQYADRYKLADTAYLMA